MQHVPDVFAPQNLLQSVSPVQDTLIALLDAQCILHTRHPTTGEIQVHQSLFLDSPSLTELPHGLRIHGAADFDGTRLTRLPERLVVRDDLSLKGCPIQELPGSLSVGGSLVLQDTRVHALPEGLCVHGGLDLNGTPIQMLPRGLRVQTFLKLTHTSLQRLPPDLVVGGMIAPPASLEDLRAFMQGSVQDAVLRKPGSAHEDLQLRAQLHAFPDLWTVMVALQDGCQIYLHADGRAPRIAWIPGCAPVLQ